MKKILALTTINNSYPLKQAVEEINLEYGNLLQVEKIYFDEFEFISEEELLESLEKKIDEADVILVDIRGDIRISRELPKLLKDKKKTVVVLVAGNQDIWQLTKMGNFKGEMIFKGKDREFNIHSYVKTKKFSEFSKILGKIFPIGVLKDLKNWVLAQQYYAEADNQNLKNLLLLLLRDYCKIKKIKKIAPPKLSKYGLYSPLDKKIYSDFENYKIAISYSLKKPTVGILMYSGMHFEECKVVADSVYEKLKENFNLIFVTSKVEYNIEAIKKYFQDIDIFLNLQYFRIHGGPYGGEPQVTLELLKKLNVPVLIPLRAYSTDIKKWQESKQGLDPLEVILGVTLPELDGAIEPIFVSTLEVFEDSSFGKVKKPTVVEDRIERLTERIKSWIRLRKKSNFEKRIAIITYNYPPGEENLANAGYLDVFESLKILLIKLKNKNYNLELPEKELKDLFFSLGIINTPNYVNKTSLRIPTEKYLCWFRELPKSVQEEITRFWGPPPGEIMVENNEILIPAVIFNNILLGVQPTRGAHERIETLYHDKDLPPHHQYLAFYMFIQKEFKADAIIHFGMHGTLEFLKGKEIALSSSCYPDILIGNIPHIYYYWVGNTSESTIAKRRSYAVCVSHASAPLKTSGLYEQYIILEELINEYEENRNDSTLQTIKELAGELRLPLEITELKKELYRLKRRLIPYGLHIMDKEWTDEQKVEYITGVLRIDREIPSILKFLAELKGLNWEEVKNTNLAEEIESQAKKLIYEILKGKQPNELPDEYIRFIRSLSEKICFSNESNSILDALEGKYIYPSCGGDPIRNPEVYPTGRSIYAFDPRLIPTIAAEVTAKKSTQILLESYIKKYEKYPETIGIVLWGFETLKTGGDTIAMILSLLGVRIKRKKNPWFKELELIPLEELKRPRIDVAITICGIFRDVLGTHIDLINRAVELAAKADEPLEKNFVRKHFLELISKKETKDFASARIFGPSPTEYATSMRTLIESSTWDSEEDLVKSYDESMNYLYFRGKIEKNEAVFSKILNTVDIVTQERDNTEYEVTDLDHYYEFLGGLSLSVQKKKNKKVDTFVVDTTEEVEIYDLKSSIELSIRSRLLNPTWIEGMLKHNFHGVAKIKDRIEYLLGFAATTGKVDNWIFDEVADKFIFNKELRDKISKLNPYATLKIAQLLLETNRRGYWSADNSKIERLKDLILELEGNVE